MIESKEDLESLINSFNRNEERIYSLAPILEDYLTYGLDQVSEINKDEVLKIKNFIVPIIKEENKSKPFEDVPAEERRLLVALRDGAENNNVDSIKFNIHEIHTVISSKSNQYERAIKQNRWSIPIAVLGILLSIIFALMPYLFNDSNKVDSDKEPKTTIDSSKE